MVLGVHVVLGIELGLSQSGLSLLGCLFSPSTSILNFFLRERGDGGIYHVLRATPGLWMTTGGAQGNICCCMDQPGVSCVQTSTLTPIPCLQVSANILLFYFGFGGSALTPGISLY